MKTLYLTLLLALTTLTATASAGHDDERSKIASEVKSMIVHDSLFDVMNFSGELSVHFTIDENDRVHITEVVTNDFSLEYHVRKTLENAVITASESLVGKTISLAIELVQSK